MINASFGQLPGARQSQPDAARRLMLSVCLILCLLPTFITSLPSRKTHAGEKEQASIEEQLLNSRGVSPNAEGVRSILVALLPESHPDERTAKLIQALGAEDFAVREATMQKILELPVPPTKLLEQASTGDDPEIRMRAARLLEQFDPEDPLQESLLFACLLLTHEQAAPNLTSELLQLAPRCTQPAFRRAAWQALKTTVTTEDIPQLKTAFADENKSIRAMALVGLLALEDKSEELKIELANLDLSQQPKLVQLVSFQHRLQQGDVEALAKLFDFCHSNDAALGLLAIDVLHRAIDSQKVSKAKLIEKNSGRDDGPGDGEIVDPRQNCIIGRVRSYRYGSLMTRVYHTGTPVPELGWADFLSDQLVEGILENQTTAFVKRLPGMPYEALQREKRTADTTNSVTSRHGTSPWLYPTEGRNEAPQVLCENGNWYFPIYGTWRQRWGQGWTSLDEYGKTIASEKSSGPHIETEVEYFVLPIAKQQP
jgi:hypothetical protein